ncbi:MULTISPECIES: GntR family transcriptional regulator [Metabacillus]|uniref:GntR family transcriptional regulator n=1 Tax=Metabacillus hrfriensis TaxID=3048891 RepID=A0ACD4RI53_9BACI|nr:MULTISPECIES: GntR family transcriptional regulator [Metabacillus]UAL54448.1 GntR family transcriptional regulator [Metabacillus dongyingensis]UOK56111.1 GntR family transcriptional regulator [Bacillus sp. OVS6]USK30766.1 GntR family transcriptional regulator [Bacillus sp. CMF21]WHZ60009.1 GntR family transcriptional regulator [Metabacillus sp. CT-WN-B3]
MPIPTNFSSPTRVTAKNRAFAQIQEWIIDGTLQPKEKLNDADLAQALGVSRTPIREALQLLNVQGFVEMFPGVGTQVTSVNKEDINKILPPLGVLQALAAELATPVISQESIDSLREINTKFAEAIKKGDFYSALKQDEHFHNIIVENAQNQYITNSISNLQAHVLRLYFHQSIILTNDSIQEHEAILQAFENKNKEKAASLARKNWIRAIDEFYAEQKEK